MTESASPRKILEHLLDGISKGRWDELHLLYAEDAVVEYPFALPAPLRLEGREAVRTYFVAVANYPLELRARDIVVHETVDPEVVVAQWEYDGRVATTGRAFQVANIQVSTVREGQIVASRDYHNHVTLANAVDRLPALLSAIAGNVKERSPSARESHC